MLIILISLKQLRLYCAFMAVNALDTFTRTAFIQYKNALTAKMMIKDLLAILKANVD